jgi:nickel transport system substrate-binding protein
MHLNRYVSSALQELSIIRPVRFLSPRSVAADGAYKDPIGTGPWILEKNDGSGAQLVRNDRYWGPKPAAERVSLVVIPDARSRIAAMRAGEIDIAGGAYLSPISPQEAATLQSSGITVVKSEGSNTMVLGFNPERPVFQDERVREAINLCIDRDAICKKLLLGYASPTVNLFPQTIPASGRRLPVPARNVAKARTLLDQAGWKGAPVRSKDGKPLSLELVISEDAVAGSRALSEVLQGQLRDAGIEVRLRLVDHVTRHDDIPARKYDMALFVSNGAPYDPHATLISLFLSTYPGGTDGKMFMDPRLDPFINAAVDSFGDAQAPAYQKVYDWIEQHHAIAAIYHPSRLWAHGKRVKGFRTPATEYDMPFAGITVA